MKPLQTTPRQVLIEAIQSEVESREILLRLSERAATPDVRKRLVELADKELLHRAKLEKKFRDEIGEAPPEPAEAKITLSNDLARLDMRRALKFVLDREREAEGTYRFLAERVPNTELGSLFLELAEIEWKHKNEIQREYDQSSGNPDDFFKDL
ncbi:MAG: ferritin family protein [Thermoanaerobaculia bacterium]|jgi:rubrerythrin